MRKIIFSALMVILSSFCVFAFVKHFGVEELFKKNDSEYSKIQRELQD